MIPSLLPLLQSHRAAGTSTFIAEAAFYSERPVLIVVGSPAAVAEMQSRLAVMEAALTPLAVGHVEVTSVTNLAPYLGDPKRCLLFDVDAIQKLVG